MFPKLQRATATIAITFGMLALAGPAFAADTTTPSVPNGNALKTYQACMKKHGVKLKLPSGSARAPGGANGAPSGEFTPPTGNGSGASGRIPGGGPFGKPKGVSTKTYNAAQRACASDLPSFGAPGANGNNGQDFQAYLSCLSDHGVKVPTSGGLAGLDRNDPTFQTANQTCGTLLPSGVAPGTGGSNST